MFVNSIAVWYRNDYRSDRTQMAMLYPFILAYDGKGEVVAQWPVD